MYTYNEVYDADGTLVSREVVEAPDTRPALEYTTEDHKPTPTTEKYLSQKNWKTFSLTGDGTHCVYVCCPKAPNSNFKCSGYELPAIPAGLDEAGEREFAADTIVQVTLFVAGLEASGCPIHDAPPAEPTPLDELIASLTPEEIGAAVQRATQQ